MKYVIGKKKSPYGITNYGSVCEVISESTDNDTGIERLKVRVLYKRQDLLFEKYNDVEDNFGNERVFPVKKRYFREIKDADSYVKRYNSKALKNVSNKKRFLEIMNINKELPITDSFEF